MTTDLLSDEQAIRALVAGAVELMRARDFASIAGASTADGVLMLPGQKVAVGHAAIQDAWSRFFPGPFEALEYGPTSIEVVGSGETAIEQGVYKVAYALPEGTRHDEGKYVVVWHKGPDGWKIAVDILNSDLDPA